MTSPTPQQDHREKVARMAEGAYRAGYEQRASLYDDHGRQTFDVEDMERERAACVAEYTNAILALISSTSGGWRSIESAPSGSQNPVLLIAQYPARNGWSDIYHGWQYEGAWARWPHRFPPTYWQPLPAAPSPEFFAGNAKNDDGQIPLAEQSDPR